MGCEARQILMQQEATITPRSGETEKRDYLWESSLWGHQSKLKVRLLAGTGIMEEDFVVGAEPMEKMKVSQIRLLEIFPKTRKGKKFSGFSLTSSINAFHWPNFPCIQGSLEDVILYNTEQTRGRVVMDLSTNRTCWTH